MSESREVFFGGSESRCGFGGSESRSGFDSFESRSFGGFSESRGMDASFSNSNYSKRVRDEFTESKADYGISKQKQDMANQVYQIKISLLQKKAALKKELDDTEKELKNIENIERMMR